MCRTRGLRSSASHLEATKELPLEEVKRDWLIDRLVCYEMHWHEKEQERAEKEKEQAKAAAEAAAKLRREKRRATRDLADDREDDIDGEAIDGIDGIPWSELELNGEPLGISDPVELLRLAEKTIPILSFASGLLGFGGMPSNSTAFASAGSVNG